MSARRGRERRRDLTRCHGTGMRRGGCVTIALLAGFATGGKRPPPPPPPREKVGFSFNVWPDDPRVRYDGVAGCGASRHTTDADPRSRRTRVERPATRARSPRTRPALRPQAHSRNQRGSDLHADQTGDGWRAGHRGRQPGCHSLAAHRRHGRLCRPGVPRLSPVRPSLVHHPHRCASPLCLTTEDCVSWRAFARA